MSALTIDSSYAGGIGQAITDAVNAGHDQLLLQAGVYAADTCTSGADGPGNAVVRLTIMPVEERESIAIDTLTLDRANYLRFLNCRFASGAYVPAERTLPLFDTSGVCLNAGIKLTPVVSDLPIPRVRVRNPRAANQSESLVVTVEGRDITVTGVSTNASKVITSTANAIIAAINASSPASALVTAAVKDGQDGSGHVQGGFPFFEVASFANRGVSVEDGTHHIEFIGCRMNTVSLKDNTHHIKVKNCYFPQASFCLTCSLNNGDPTVSDVIFQNNYCYGGYNTDCMGVRPAEFDNWVIADNVFEDNCDPEASTIHSDTIQPIFGGRQIKIQRNKFIDQSGQCFFMDNYIFHQVLIENNLIHQDGEANLICQLSGVKTGIMRNNTIISNGWLFDDGDGGQIPDGLIVYNNITRIFSRTAGVPVDQDYNIVDVAGTGWTPGTNETSTLPTWRSPGHPDWDYHYFNSDQPGVGDGTTEFRLMGSPTTDLDGNLRDPESVDQGCFVFAAYVPPVVPEEEEEPPRFVAAGSGAARTTSGVLSVPYPTDVAANDYLLLHLYFDHSSASMTWAGWTTLSGPNARGSGRDWLLAKIAAGSEAGTNADSSTNASTAVRAARIYGFRGVDVAGTPYEQLGVGVTGTSTTVQDIDITTTVTNTLALNFVSLPDDIAIATFAGQTGGVWVEAVDEYTSALGNGACLQLQMAEMAAAGTIGGGTTTISETEIANRYRIALRPTPV